MNYKIDMQVLRLYSKQERIALSEISRLIGMNGNTISRYVTGSRNPDLNTLLHICNTLRVSVGAFIHHSDVIIGHIEVYTQDTFKPITYRYDAIEEFRNKNEMTRVALLQHIRKHSDISIDPSTYGRIVERKRVGLDLPIGFMNAYNLPLEYLFDDAQLNVAREQATQTTIPTNYLNELKERIKQLEGENARLLAENRRLKLSTASAITNVVPQDLSRTMRQLLHKIERNLSELGGCCDALYGIDTTNDK